MTEITNIPTIMKKAAKKLSRGKLLCVYRDHKAIRCEMEHGLDPYVWRGGAWRRMRFPQFGHLVIDMTGATT